MRLTLAIAIGFGVSSVVHADDTGPAQFDFLKAAEVPVHRLLMRQIARDPTALAAFTTDGCSGGMSAGWTLVVDAFPELAGTQDVDLPWAPCCVTHDRAYHAAGDAEDAEASYEARLAADETLRLCVIATGQSQLEATMDRFGLSEERVALGYRLLAGSMYNAVRLGGGPCTRLPWRWGYGYDHC